VVFLVRFPYIINYVNRDEKLNASPITVVSTSNLVDSFLKSHEAVIGPDLEGYRNHIYRVLSFSQHIMKTDESYIPSGRNDEILAAAIVYHDIGLWSDGALAYLEPSVNRARQDLSARFSDKEMEVIHNIIYWHHKSTPFKSENKQMDIMVNAVRCADWIDFTFGFVSMGMPSAHIEVVRKAIPNAGFHKTLLGFGPKLRGWDLYTIVKELSTIFKM
jgi:hypothetical protein